MEKFKHSLNVKNKLNHTYIQIKNQISSNLMNATPENSLSNYIKKLMRITINEQPQNHYMFADS